MTDQTIQRQVTVGVPEGLHLRPADAFVSLAKSFAAQIEVQNKDVTADGKSILELIALAAAHGAELTISATGSDAQAAVDGLTSLVERNFDIIRDDDPANDSAST
ncbi:MAG: HPr family phosphocarrier protein [Pirellulaceae bacterium]|jgi:phosphotransferase system HPr (HPr) family protein|nr:HPr family phosphocarrier protein [Pirellulaceae bacterium]MDP6719544.1 HPr family phosphocarrier protein [Pirellulaceae bacterium]MDP7018854.1 HPr family phosphocarrier protein [Pirellulaceae bacterium]